jgi:two-component system cell cycle sensor histidine kinase/response regulator CckA
VENTQQQLEPQKDADLIAEPAPLTGPGERSGERSRGPLNLDALSVLAGGVAHHFNNLLCVILGYAEMLMDELSQREEWAAQAREIYSAADKAATLAHQLLAFSRRQRTPVDVVDPNALIRGLETLLRPMVTETVKLEMDLDPEVPPVLANRLQLELCVLNLVLNAKEAMPGGGVLTISTRAMVGPDFRERGTIPLEAGVRYARIAVSDTGRGIPPDVRDRLFEPFFTTKDVGQGTGMGLSMVYGIVRQAGGDVRVTSAVGEGSTFSLVLPETDVPAGEVATARPIVHEGGSETVLLVEDEERVRNLVLKSLVRVGYTVIAAGDAEEAVRILEQRAGEVQLLVTDVVLPGSNGLDLARRVTGQYPDVKVLYISGYGAADLSRYGPIDPAITLLQKPFRPPELIHAVRAVLDRGKVARVS